VSRGSGNLRSNLKNGWQKINKSQAVRPLIRNRVMKKRDIGKKKAHKKSVSVIDYDQIKSDNVKRILKNF
jgi:hypothetical protein